MKNDNKITKFFASDKLLMISMIIFVPLCILNIISKIYLGLYSLVISDCIFLICTIFLYIAFMNHNKNVQKGLLGAVLMWYLIDELNYVVSSIIFNPDVFEQYSSGFGMGYVVLSVITLVLFVIFFIMHFVITSDHRSKAGTVAFELVIGILLAVISLASIIFQLPEVSDSPFGIIECVTWHILLAALLCMVASFEAHFEQWKELRES